MRNVYYLYVGYFLLALYIAQDAFGWKFEFLEILQTQQGYRRWSGVALLCFMVFQWSLTLARVVPAFKAKSVQFYTLHKWIGAFSPVFYYVHATHLGYAYLFVLSFSFFANFAVGLINMDFIKTQASWYLQTWMIVHVTLSSFISLLMFYHIWMVFYYN